jgi:hypothetical protein
MPEVAESTTLLQDIEKSLKEQGISLDDEVSYDTTEPEKTFTVPDGATPDAPIQIEKTNDPVSLVRTPETPGQSKSVDPQAAPQNPGLVQQAVTPSADTGLYDFIKEQYGPDVATQLQGKYRTDSELVKGLINAHHLVGQRDEDATIGRQFRPYANDFVQYLASRQKGQAQGGQPQVPEANPSFKPEWKTKIQVSADASGKETLTGDPVAISEYNAWKDWSQSRIETLVSDPEKIIGPLVEKKAREIAEAKIREYTNQRDSQAFAGDFLEQSKAWMWDGGQYYVTPQGQVQGNLTEMGKLFTEKMYEGASLGIQKDQDRVKYATNAVYAEYQYRNSQNQATPAPPVVQSPNIQAAVHSPSAATVATGAPDGDEGSILDGESLANAILRNAKRHGVKF